MPLWSWQGEGVFTSQKGLLWVIAVFHTETEDTINMVNQGKSREFKGILENRTIE